MSMTMDGRWVASHLVVEDGSLLETVAPRAHSPRVIYSQRIVNMGQDEIEVIMRADR
jgi:hypothetical protein